MKGVIFILFLGICTNLLGQSFADLRGRYDHFAEDDENAFAYISQHLKKARSESNSAELIQGYKDAVYFSKSNKLVYADSAIAEALRYGHQDLVANAYMTKGTVYYFTFRKFKPALDEFMKAWNYSHLSNNQYVRYKNLYYIGVVKSYLGSYEEAARIFKETNCFFGSRKESSHLPNTNYNYQKCYLNGLHQYAVCLLALGKVEECEKVIEEGLSLASKNSDYQLERSYFFKQRGVLQFSRNDFKAALQSFENALPGIEKNNDFAQLGLIYYYTGKSYWNLGDQEEAVKSFVKVDNIFRARQFILPQARNSYELLIDFYRKSDDHKMQLYYTTQLLKADQIISSDFLYLAKKIHKEYDTRDLLISKTKLESEGSRSKTVVVILSAAILGILAVVVQRNTRSFFGRIERTTAGDVTLNEKLEDEPLKTKAVKPSEEIVSEILAKLDQLEKRLFFLQHGITQNQLASKLKTNTSYLSFIINEHKGSSFSSYVNSLRIQYATKMLTESNLWRKYTVETLASQSGFKNRVIFSRLFMEHHGMTSTEFIKAYGLDR